MLFILGSLRTLLLLAFQQHLFCASQPFTSSC